MWRHRLSMELHCRLLMLLLLIGSPLLLGVKGDCQPHLYTCESEFYPFGHIQNDDTLSKSQSRISDGIHLSEDFILYDEKISNVYISENGLILLENVSDNTVSKFVAPYYADADIRESGEVYFRQTNDPSLLQRANSEIRAAFSLPQNTTMQNLLIVTWFRVGYYSINEIEDNKTNTFQCVLATSGLESFVIFLYAHGRIQWTTGDFEGGQNGLGGFTAMAAINAGDDVNYIIVPTSRTPEIINIDETSNVGIPGVWMFQVGKKYSVTVFLDPPAYGNTSNFEYLVGSKITLTCMVTPPPPSDSEFSWRCSTGCFVGMETEQSVKLDVTDSGELNCSVVVDGVEYTSKLIKLQAIAECRPELYTCESEFYPFGHSENDSTLPPLNDVDSEGMNLTTNLTYYDEQISRVYISDNGIIKFENGYVSPYPEYFPYPSKFVAPYWANVDLTGIGEVFYRQTTNPDLLARATNEIRAAFPVYHYITMKNLVIATWYRVGYYRRNVDKTNTFQCVLATDGYKSFVLFLYAYGRIQWTTGDDGDGVNGLGGDEALAGINGYFARSIAINGSETPDIINIDETSNVGIPGVWMLKLGEVPRYNASITSDPLNYGNNDNIIFEFNAGSNLTLICMVTPTPPSNSTFRWSCNGCSIDGKNEQSIYISEVDFSLRGEINCSVIVGYETYTSIPIRLGVIAKCQPEIFTCESEFYPFGYSHNDSSLPLRYSSISEGIQLSDDLIFYNERISRIYVTDNGIIYFDDNQAYTRYSNSFFLPRRGFKLVAPYWANAEIRGIGQVFYRQTTDPSLLARATSEIRAAFPEYQNVTMQSLLIATWYKVGYGGRFAIYTDKTNTFQCVLATDGVSSFIIFLYAHGRIQWTSGDGSGGKDGFGGREALAGINSGDGFNYITIPGSQAPDIINIDETSNVGIPGVWMFQTVKRFNAAVSPAWIFTRNNNTWMYPFGYNITLTCRVTPTPPSDSEFSWSCSAGCFVVVETEQSVNIKVTKSREINCAVIIDGMEYISEPIELQPVGYHVNVNVEARLQADVRVNANIVEYIAGTHFSLRCRATPTPPSDSEFSWSCSTGCIPNTKTKQRYNITELEGADSAELNCSVIIGDMEYTSQSVTLREIECQPVSYTCESEFYPFGYSNNDSSLPSYSDSNSGRIRLSEDLIFYDKRVDSIYVSENGIIDFDSVSYLHNPTALPRRGFKFVAPYLADVDTREAGQVFYRQTTDSSLLVRATSEITEAFPEHQNITMKNLIIATWYRVGYRSPFSRNANKTNTFQCVLATDGVESFVIFLYAHNKIQWTTGNTSDGLGGTGALVGINAGDGVNYVAIHGSLTPEIINITERSNVGIPGVWMFQISKRACQPELYTCLSEFYPFGLTQNDATLTMFDDTSSGEFHLAEDFIFYNKRIRSIYLRDNGIIVFNYTFWYFYVPDLLLPRVGAEFIAPFWADFDNTEAGNIYYRQTTDPDLLVRATSEIRAAFSTHKHFSIKHLFIATLDAVGYYSRGTDKTNTFQCVLATDGVESFVMFLYAFEGIQWTTADSSGGYGGLGRHAALAGINAGDGVNSVVIPGSQTPEIINIDQTSNVGIPGVWMFQVGEDDTRMHYYVNIVTDPNFNVINNTIEVPAGSDLTLTCMVTPPPPSDSEFSWSCSTGCFVDVETEQSVNITELEVTDSGELNCSVIVDGEDYTSEPTKLKVTEDGTMDCKGLVSRCKGKCKRLYRKVRRSCRDLTKRRPDCLQSCTAAVKKLLKNEVGNAIWHCGNPKGKLQKLRKAYIAKC